ncbi:YwqJ-related putative deaminase [Micromonospora sp. WMMD967]|uniref:YwqJ-related putative deaminase n=1 Tax=Micromonospora sp. WMMD967 TaxID=3016101 RepID=UPI0024170F24|nr:YwqJ-related putative deaminase [Micromonospora sp. WMMD967]MDG4835723.1 YwqJ-related putative deaminase [Micromonospora sp. WMMD967]
MINPGEIPQIPGNMELLASHAQTIKTTGVDFANTGQAVDTTWQGLAAVYEAPEAAQLFAASGPIRTVSASVGEDVQAVGTALATYASEVKEIKAQLAALKGQAEQFVASTNGDEDWREDEGKVDKHNGLISAVNTQVAAFFEAQRKCANTINALYGGRQYRADNADGTVEDGEYGFDANTLNAAAGEDGALPWGSTEEHDRGFLGDVGAFFGGIGEGFVTMLGDLGALIGRDPTTGEWSWGTAGQSWLGLGKFVWAVSIYVNPVTIVIDQTVGMPFMEKREAGNLLLNAGKTIIAYDMWGEDKSRAGGLAAFNIVSAVVGTKGAASGLRGAGAAVNGIRGSATAARISAGLVRAGNWLDNLPTVGEVAINFAKKFDIQIPQLGLVPSIAGDVPTTRGFDVEMPNERGGNQMNMDGGNRPGGNNPGPGTNLPGDTPPLRDLPGDTPPVRDLPGDTPPVRDLPGDTPPTRNLPEDNTPGNLPDDTPGNLPDDTPGNLPDDTPGNLPDDTPGNLPDDTPGNLPDDTPGNLPDDSPGTTPDDNGSAEAPQRIPEDRTKPQVIGRVEGDLTRDADGLITHVDGKPLDEYLRDTATRRTDEIRDMRTNGAFSAKDAGPVNSVAVDLRTGEIFEGINGRPRDVIPDDKLHPILRERLEEMRANGPYPQYNRDGTPMMRDGEQVMTPYPHGDNPLRHAEVKAVNEMLNRRGPDVDASVMSEFRVDNRFPFRNEGPVPAPCCANCHRLLAGTPSNAGRLTYDSGHPDSAFIPE